METKLTTICRQLRPGISDFLLMPFAFLGLIIGIAIYSLSVGPFVLVPLMTLGIPALVAYDAWKDARLSDDECRQLLDAAETPDAQSMVRKLYCNKGHLMKSDANRILEWLQQQQHSDLNRRMGCAT